VAVEAAVAQPPAILPVHRCHLIVADDDLDLAVPLPRLPPDLIDRAGVAGLAAVGADAIEVDGDGGRADNRAEKW